MSTTFQIAEVAQRSGFTAATLPVDGPCGDTCGCATDSTAPATSATSVPLVAKEEAAPGDSEEVPVACTLGAREMSGRLEEWNALLADKPDLLQGVTARRALDDGGLRLEFGRNTEVTEIARLAAAEHGCCRFFSFAVIIDNRGTALEVHAPPDAQPVLAALFGTAA